MAVDLPKLRGYGPCSLLGRVRRQVSGERLLVSEKTVKNYVSMLFARLGMKRRTQVAAYAARAFPGAAPGAGHTRMLPEPSPWPEPGTL